MMEWKGRIHSIESFGTLDGPGVRFVIFLQGCPLNCLYCHNPDTWEPEDGRRIAVSELLRQIESCRNFIRSGGVTLSGGEPLMQADFSRQILERCRSLGIHTALDTSGAYPLEVSQPVIDAADLILLDIKALDPSLCRDLTGMDNRYALATLDYCEKTGKPVWIRHVLVPGWTFDPDRLKALAAYLEPFHCIQKVELLAFHKMGCFKWRALGLPNALRDTPEVTEEQRQVAEALFVKVGQKQNK